MKKLSSMKQILLAIIVASPQSIYSQCFDVALNSGKEEYYKGNYSRAIEIWKTAKRCSDAKAKTLNDWIWKAGDDDGDGIINAKDKCPTVYAKNSDGCLRDKDGDSVPDDLDECPDKKGEKALKGCPDSDKDGVPDHLDKCKSLAGPTHWQGCPDSDGDEVPDHEDQCPTKKGILANKGCPEEKTSKPLTTPEKSQREGEKEETGPIIEVSNISVETFEVQADGKEVKRSRASKIEKLKICFIPERNTTTSNKEIFYIRVTDPTGSTLAQESLGSGIALDKRTGWEFRYTVKATCNKLDGKTPVCGTYAPGNVFVKGKYQVEVYNKGYLVGESSFNL